MNLADTINRYKYLATGIAIDDDKKKEYATLASWLKELQELRGIVGEDEDIDGIGDRLIKSYPEYLVMQKRLQEFANTILEMQLGYHTDDDDLSTGHYNAYEECLNLLESTFGIKGEINNGE